MDGCLLGPILNQNSEQSQIPLENPGLCEDARKSCQQDREEIPESGLLSSHQSSLKMSFSFQHLLINF